MRMPGSLLALPGPRTPRVQLRSWLRLAPLLLAPLLLGGCSGNDAADDSSSAATGSHSVGNPPNTGGPSTPSASPNPGMTETATLPTPNTPAKLHYTWETGQLTGNVFTPKLCEQLGADTVGVHLSGATLETGQNHYSTNGEDCATGDREEDWTFGPGSFWLGIALYPSAGQIDRSIVSRSVPFTVEAGQTEIAVHVKVVYTRYPLAWTIDQAGANVTCDEVNAHTVEFKLVQRLSEFTTIETTWTVGCDEMGAGSPPLYPGEYELYAQLLGNDGQLATWSAPQPLIVTDEEAPPLPEITFSVP
jgi:hypothetical protein